VDGDYDLNSKKPIVFDDVCIGSENIDLLKNVSFQVGVDEKIALIGENGCGKSTLLKSIVGLVPYKTGNVQLFQRPTNLLSTSEIRKRIVYVPQKTFFFLGTVLENVTMGIDSESISEDVVLEVLQQVELFDLVSSLPNGLATNISEIASFSGGEMQRLALARALLMNPKVLLLDEATSNVDSATEKRIYQRLVRGNFAIIAILHGEANLKMFNSIFKIQLQRLTRLT
jgi:ATP-binding cassette subfamily B protein